MSIKNIKPNEFVLSNSVLATKRDITSKFKELVSVLDYGADPTGTTDSSEAFNYALDENNKVVVPANSTFLLNQPIRIQDSNKVLIGSGASSVLKITTNGWFKDTSYLQARVTEAATIPTSGNVQLKLTGAYKFISNPHNEVITPNTNLPNATNIILGRNKQVVGTLKGVTGTLYRNNLGNYIFTPTVYPSNPVSVVVGDLFNSTALFEATGGMVTIGSWGVTPTNDRTTYNTTISNLKFIGLTYQDLVNSLGTTVADSYDNSAWKGSRRMPKFIYSNYVDGVVIEDCYFERHSHEGIWLAGQNNGTSKNFYIRRNYLQDVGYEPTNNTPLPAIQCNFTNAIVEGNTLLRSGTGIGGSGSSLLITNNKILGFAGDGISWGDNNCFDVSITNNQVYCDETNIPIGSTANNPNRVALSGFFSGENLFYRNMVCKGNTVRLKNVQGIGVRISSPFEGEIVANKIYIENPPNNNATGIRVHNVSTNGKLDTYINQNTITYEGLINDNSILVAAIRLTSSNTNIVNAYLSQNTVNGLIASNTNHWFLLTDNSSGGTINYYLNGDRKTAGLIRVPNRLITSYPNNTPLYLAASTSSTNLDIQSSAYFDNSTFARIGNVQLAQNQAAKLFSSTVIDAATNSQSSGVLLVTLQYGNSRKSKTYFVSTSFDNALVNGTWYKLSPIFSTDNTVLGVDLIVTSSNSGMLLELGVMSGLSGNTNIAMTVLPLSGLLPTILRISSTTFTAPKPIKWSFYDGLVKFNNAATGVVNSTTSTNVKIPIEVSGGLYYASATDQNDVYTGTPPFTMTNIRLWLESDRAVTTDSTNNVLTASNWTDNSTALNNATQTTKASQFLYLRNTLNGIPVLRSDSTGKRFSVNNFALTNGITLIALLRLTANGNFQGLFSKSSGATAAPIDILTGNGNRIFQVSGASTGQTTALILNTWYILSITHDKTNVAYYLDGVSDGTATGGWGANDTGNCWIGGRDDAGTKLVGDLAALVIYDGVDNTARINVENYFKQKRGY